MDYNNSNSREKKVQYAFDKSDFIIVPNAERVISELNLSELKVYLALAKHSNKDGVSYPSKKRIAQLTNLTPRVVQKAIASLKSKGLIVVEEQWTADGRQTTNRYTIVAEGRALNQGRVNTDTAHEEEPQNSLGEVYPSSQNLTNNELNHSNNKSVISSKNHRSSSASSGEPRPSGAVVSIETTLSSVEEKESSPSLPQLRKNQPQNNSAPPPRIGFHPPDEDPTYLGLRATKTTSEVSGYYSGETPPAKRRETPKYSISRERVKAYAKRLGLPYCELLTIAEQLEQEMALRGKRYRNPYKILLERGEKQKAQKPPPFVVIKRYVKKDGRSVIQLVKKSLVDNSEEIIGYKEEEGL